VGRAFALSLSGAPLLKPVTLDLALAQGTASSVHGPAIYAEQGGAGWRLLGARSTLGHAHLRRGPCGGTVCDLRRARRARGRGRLAALSLTPRAFSPRGSFAGTSVGIGFVLSNASTVRVTVHNRAGRLVREVVSGLALGLARTWSGGTAATTRVAWSRAASTWSRGGDGDRLVQPLAVVR